MSIGARGQPFADLQSAGMLSETAGADLLQVLTKAWRPGAPGGSHNLLYTSALEVRYGGSRSNLSDGGVWLSARLQPLCSKTSAAQAAQNDHPCGWNITTRSRLFGWNVATAALPLGRLNASQITAVRYGWGEDPCCPQADRTLTACPPGAISLSALCQLI
jgi:hypothetical protein